MFLFEKVLEEVLEALCGRTVHTAAERPAVERLPLRDRISWSCIGAAKIAYDQLSSMIFDPIRSPANLVKGV